MHPESDNRQAGTEERPTEILCAKPKCRKPTPRGHRRCMHCGAHLYVTCNECGHRNVRVAANCTHCGHHLHRSFWRRLAKRYPKIAPFHILLIAVIFALGLAFVFLLPKVLERLPQPEPIQQ